MEQIALHWVIMPFDQKDMLQFIEQEDRILRPLNFSKSAPGKGSKIYADKRGRKILVSQVLGQVFMNDI